MEAETTTAKKRCSNVCCIQPMQAIFKFKLRLDFSYRKKLTANCGVVDMLVSNTWLRNREGKNNKQSNIYRVHLQSFKNRDSKVMIDQMIFQSGKMIFNCVFCYSWIVLAQAKTNHKQNVEGTPITTTTSPSHLVLGVSNQKRVQNERATTKSSKTTPLFGLWAERLKESFTISLNQHIFPNVVFFSTSYVLRVFPNTFMAINR